MMNRILCIILGALILTACSRQSGCTGTFTVNGEISGADGRMLYFERLGLDGVVTVDSVRLKEGGLFSFSDGKPDCFEFYRLRSGDKSLVVAVDSTETVTVSASYPELAGYSVEGSESSLKLKELISRQTALMQEISAAAQAAGAETGTLSARIGEMVDVFKSGIGQDFILKNPSDASSYYALFMSVNGTPLFRPQALRQDAKYFAAVATAMDLKYPDAVRTHNIHNIALKGMKATSRPVRASDEVSEYMNSLITESGVLEIELPDAEGTVHRITDLKGKVVLLDFTALKADYSAEYTLMLRELYSKYAGSGFEIFQVSIDPDEHFWINAAENLPWICVHDEENLASEYLKLYRVETLPTAFLLDRNNDIVERMQDYRDLDSHIAALLK